MDTQAHSKSTSANEPLPQRIGRYRILKLLGSGGMGKVFLAQDEQLDRPVALKVPRIENDPEGKIKKRFLREARTVATLNHPNICPVYDVGEEEGMQYIAMSYIEGRPLHDFVSSGKQAERLTASVVRKVALALHEAHEQGVLHRDLKPANIMIDKRGEPIVMDFGLSVRLDIHESRLTQEGSVVGTPEYMAPEQIDGRAEVGPASDVYSLGVVCYELLTGTNLYSGSMVSVIGKVLHGESPSVADVRPDLSLEMAAICDRATNKDPAIRFPNMKEFARALTAYLKNQSTADSVTTLNARAKLLGKPGKLEPEAAPAETSAAAKLIGIGGTAAALALVLFGLYYAFAKKGPSEIAPAASEETALPVPEIRPPQPRPHERYYVSTRQEFDQKDANRDGFLSPSEYPRHIIRRADGNHDDRLDFAEMQSGLEKEGAALFRPPFGHPPPR